MRFWQRNRECLTMVAVLGCLPIHQLQLTRYISRARSSRPIPAITHSSGRAIDNPMAIATRDKSARVWVRRILAKDRRICLLHWLRFSGAVAIRSRGARHFSFTYHTVTGRIFLRLSNRIVVRLTADKTPSSRCALTGKMFRATTCSP